MVLEVRNIAKSFGRKKVLEDVSFDMPPSTVNGITGENGSGKTTLLKIIVGEWKADGGTISVRGRIGYCPQKTLLFPQLTVEEHLQYFSSAYGLDRSEFGERSRDLLQFFRFEKYLPDRVEVLSGGTQQKLNLVISLLHRPDILILDEPYNGFDWDTYLKFWKYTEQLKQSGCAILIVSHFLTERERFDRIYNLERGRFE